MRVFLLPQAVERSAARDPEKDAFRFLGDALTYAALDAEANRLAHLLRSLGVQRGDRVGIFLAKGLRMPVAVYGILKAGAAYVPLDIAAPCERLRRILLHCGVRVIVSDDSIRSRLEPVVRSQGPVRHVVGIAGLRLDGGTAVGWDALAAWPEQRPPVRDFMEQDLAYIMYTSGSTGEPKGIMHTHASGMSYASHAAETYGVRSEDRLGNHSPLHFDMSTFDYFTGPLCGATTVMIPEAHTKLPASLSQLMQDERLTIWYSVPFALVQLLLRGVLEQRRLESLRWVMFGGEPFPPKHLHALMALWPWATFSNVYGPAEVNQCTYFHVPRGLAPTDEPIPIGKAWAGAELLVVDERDDPVEAGNAGELLVRTPTMMRGYWERPDLNAMAFHHRSVTADVSDSFYRTGDLVAARDDGQLLFLGRKDRQIKTRGYRVELDEVEAALASHNAVEEAAAYGVLHAEGSLEIEGAVILKSGATIAAAELRKHVAGWLPHYAVPADVLVMQAFPRTATGKIDRTRLRDDAVNRAARPVS